MATACFDRHHFQACLTSFFRNPKLFPLGTLALHFRNLGCRIKQLLLSRRKEGFYHLIMAPRWKSPVITVSSDSSEDPQTVTVPCSGWYGLCFETMDNCDCVYAACDTSSDDDNASLLSLPQHVGNDKVSSLEVGTLLYLEESSNMSVSLKAPCCLHTDQVPSFEWCLFLQFKGGKDEYHTKKSLICSECCRMFSSMHSVQDHIEAMHKHVEPNSIWAQPLKVIYQDECLVVIDKPQGMPVMGDKPTLFRSNLLLALVGKSKDALKKPVHVHRLDAPTGGLLVLAKTKAAEVELKSSFATRSCRKRYLALALGRIEPKEGMIEEPISGKVATTRYKVVEYFRSVDDMATDGWVTLVDLHPQTGRNHQLRRHLKHIGHPIWGDKRYASYRKRKAEDVTDGADVVNSTSVEQDPHCRLCLWATEITFPHPETGVDLTVSLDDRPDWLVSLLAYQEKLLKEEQR